MSKQTNKNYSTNPFVETSSYLESHFDGTNTTVTDFNEPNNQLNLAPDANLPIYGYKDDIQKSIRENPVVVLTGSTGCGKTTQVPKLIAQDCERQQKQYNILVSQPRKIAAITNSKRVAQEIGCKLGNLVGYQVGLHQELSKTKNGTRICYCTTGVILQKLIRNKSMQMFSHIVLDEIHERDIDMDFLLILIRRFLFSNSRDTKIILMSATMDTKNFSVYFENGLTRVPIINMDSKRAFEIKKIFLDDLNVSLDRLIYYEKPSITDEMMRVASNIILNERDKNSSILVFLPGYYEIENFERVLMSTFDVLENYKIIILHSALTPDDQKQAFKLDQRPKIILSTNIAENSVTIPNVHVVIDFCLTKYLYACKDSNLASLKINWSSVTSCIQRAGRTGRVCEGKVYHLVNKQFYDSKMPKFTEPEMKRVPLESVVLRSKLISTISKPSVFLSEALDPPDASRVHQAVLALKSIGAFHRFNDYGDFEMDDGEQSFLGRVLATMPCDINVAKFMVLGYMFSVLDEAIIIAAGLTINGSIFRFDFSDPLGSYSKRLEWNDGAGSDLLAIRNAYGVWLQHKKDEQFEGDIEAEWFKTNNLDRRNIYEMRDLIREFKQRLDDSMNPPPNPDPIPSENKPFLLKICIAGAFLPYFFVQEPPKESYERTATQDVNFLNVHRTIYFKDTENSYIKLYNDMLKQTLVDIGICQKFQHMDVKFEELTRKVFVTFTRNEQLIDKRDDSRNKLTDGLIMPEVYVAIKYKELNRGKFQFRVLDPIEMQKLASNEEYKHIETQNIMKVASKYNESLSEMEGVVTHIDHCKKFFFKPQNEKYKHDVRMMVMMMQKAKLGPIEDLQLSDGKGVLVRYNEALERAIVIKTSKDAPVQYNLIDVGAIVCDINVQDVFVVTTKQNLLFQVPPRCFECSLKGIEISFLNSPRSVWTEEAIDFFRECVSGKTAKIETFSVVDGVTVVTLRVDGASINELLVQKGYARESEEGYNSRQNSIERHNSFNLSFENSTSISSKSFVSDAKPIFKPLLVPLGMSNITLNLSGPHSPLESSLLGVSANGNCQVKVDRSSVNSVVLNGDVDRLSSRFYIAANLAKNRNDGLNLRDLTMMPNIAGWAEVLCLIFCPTMVLRCNKDKTRYVALLAGLGCDSNHTPYLPYKDASFPVTVKLNDNDFSIINQLRSCMSKLMHTNHGEDFPNLKDEEKVDLQRKIRENITRVTDDRDLIGESEQQMEHSWKPDERVEMVSRTDPLGKRALFEMHNYPKLNKVSQEMITKLKSQMNVIDEKIKTSQLSLSAANDHCPLCGSHFNSVKEMTDHYYSLMHNKKKAILFKEQSKDV